MADESLHELATSFRAAASRILPELRQVVSRGSLNVKNRMRQDAQGHRHFPRLGMSISYDINSGPGFVEGEIGPGEGVLAGIAYFGSSKPGGGTVADPRIAMEAEERPFAENIAAAAQRVVAGP